MGRGGVSAMCLSDITHSHPVSYLPPPKLPTLQSCCRVTPEPSVPSPECPSLLGGRRRYHPAPHPTLQPVMHPQVYMHTGGCARTLLPPWCCRCCTSGSCSLPPASPSARWPAASPDRLRGSGWWRSRQSHLCQGTGGHLEGWMGQSHHGPPLQLPRWFCPS